jgi:hypothetical protein
VTISKEISNKNKVGRKKKEKTVMSRIPLSLRDHLSKLGNVRDLLVKACCKEYGYKEKEEVKDDDKVINPFI